MKYLACRDKDITTHAYFFKEIIVCNHCLTPVPSTQLCDNCGSFSKRLVKIDRLIIDRIAKWIELS